MAYQVINFSICPRCEHRGLESFKTHITCHACNYSPDQDLIANFEGDQAAQIPDWAIQLLKEIGMFRRALSQKSNGTREVDLNSPTKFNPEVA